VFCLDEKTAIQDLARKLMRYIRHYNRTAQPIKWAYSDPKRRISPDTSFACYRQLGHLHASLG